MKSSSLRPSLSTLLVSLFFFILLFLGLFAEVFETQSPEIDLAQIYANPIPVDELQHMKKLMISNKNGNFVLENTNLEGDLSGPWQMVEPQALRMKSDIISKIVDTLNIIRVRNFHPLEPINLTSFSLDNPTLTLNFTSIKDKVYEVKMGLINPIDNSAYMTISSQNQIYQIDPLEMTLESYDLAQLVESKILALNMSSLVSLEIYSGTNLTTKLLKKETGWVNQAGEELNPSKVESFFGKLEGLKSSSILEKLTPEQTALMESSVSTPLYTLRIISNTGLRNYFIGEVRDLGALGLSKGSGLVLTTDEKKSFVVIEKDQVRILTSKPSDLK